MKRDIDALREAVQAVNPSARVERWVTIPDVIRISVPKRNMLIDISDITRLVTIDATFMKGAKDRAVLRAVIDEIDRQEEPVPSKQGRMK